MFQPRQTPIIDQSTADLLSLRGKVCVVTGGSSGIGLEIVRAFASMGGDVMIVYNSTPVANVVEELKQSYPDIRVDSFQCNLNQVDQIKRMLDDIIDRYKKIDVMVANAGISWTKGGVNEFRSDKELVDNWEEFIKIDLSSVYYCSAYVGKIFEKQEFGSLILTSSMSGSVINIPQLQTPYNVAKAGIKQLAKSLAVEWASIGDGRIRVNSVSPGYVSTKLTSNMNPELLTKWKALTPLGRLGTPRELTGAYVYLSSEACSYTTGTDIMVDGGYSAV